MGYDPAIHRWVLFGGEIVQCSPAQLDGTGRADAAATWLFDGEHWTATRPASAPFPPPASGDMTFDPGVGKMVYVGEVNDQLLTWTYDGQTWKRLHTPDAPTVTLGGLTYDPARSDVVLWPATPDAPQWVFDGHNWSPTAGPPHPGETSAIAEAYDPATRLLTVVMSSDLTGSRLVTYVYADGAWMKVKTHGAPPLGAASLSLLPDPTGDGVFLFAEPISRSLRPAVWQLRHNQWRRLENAGPLTQRRAVSLTSDPGTRTLVSFGGITGGTKTTAFADMWTFDGHAWRLADRGQKALAC